MSTIIKKCCPHCGSTTLMHYSWCNIGVCKRCGSSNQAHNTWCDFHENDVSEYLKLRDKSKPNIVNIFDDDGVKHDT